MSRVPMIRHIRPFAAGVGAAALLSMAAPLFAQDEPLPKGNSAEEVAQRKAANDEQLKFAQDQLAQNKANQDSYDKAMAEYKNALAQVEQEKADIASKTAENQRLHDEAVAKWKADVYACEHGEKSRCAPPHP